MTKDDDFYDDATEPEATGFGPVFMATYESEDACCGEGIVPGEDIRADGHGGWIHADTGCEKLVLGRPGAVFSTTACPSRFLVHNGECFR